MADEAISNRLLADGKKAEAITLDKSRSGEGQPKHVRLAATRGSAGRSGKEE